MLDETPTGRTILLIEDNQETREGYAALLERLGHTVLEAPTGREGIEQARRHRPDLVIMDMGLPDVDGWLATAALKRDAATAAIPVLAVTAYGHDFYRARAEVVGCDAFLQKPCEARRLLAEVDRLLSAGS